MRGSYPHFHVSHSLSDFRSKWDYLKNGERDETSEVYVAGAFFVFFLISRENYKQAECRIEAVFLRHPFR